jgi:serine/threonine protein kinase
MSTYRLTGHKLDEYLLEAPLGMGGMAHVYRGIDTRLKRYVALKVIHGDTDPNSEDARRFEREAQSLARLEHPNIVHVYRFGHVDGYYYIAMSYVKGMDLGRILADYRTNNEVMPLKDVARVVSEVCAALDYIHSRGIIHRDIKPGNIMVNEEGQAVLTDFGLALLHDIGSQGEVLGSPRYIAPEQVVSSANVVPQTDFYSLGMTLFEMLTGDLPFAGDGVVELAMQHMNEIPRPPSQFNPAIPEAIDSVVMRCLQKEAAKRFQTGQEFDNAFQTALVNWQNGSHTTLPSRPPSAITVPEIVVSQLQRQPLPDVPPVPGTLIFADNHPIRIFGLLIPRSVLIVVGAVVALFFLFALFFTLFNRSAATVVTAPTVTQETSLPATPLVTSSLQIASPFPTNTFVATNVPPKAPTVQIPPADRTYIPPGSHRLGEFTVESYCTNQGFGVTLTNSNRDWACTRHGTSAIAFVLQSTDFDKICQSTFSNSAAFALQDMHKSTAAYNWSCFVYVVPTAIPPTAQIVVTPSLATLKLQRGPGWVALVNISTSLVGLDGISFKQNNQTLTSANWKVSQLPPAACLRIYADQPPIEIPPNCETVIDLTGSPDQRRIWFQGTVIVTINPTLSFNYTN